MSIYSTRTAAKKLGIHFVTLQRYIAADRIPAPKSTRVGGGIVRAWTEEDIERVRRILPTIANGRKTRYQKLREKEKTQARASPPQPRQKRPGPGTPAPVPHKSRSAKRKKTNK